jgi:hypothetical protein
MKSKVMTETVVSFKITEDSFEGLSFILADLHNAISVQLESVHESIEDVEDCERADYEEELYRLEKIEGELDRAINEVNEQRCLKEEEEWA